MNWDAIGAIGSILGAGGVIVSLIYLAVQIRNQNRESQLSAANELAAQWSAAMSDVATNAELAKILQVGLERVEDLEPHQYMQFTAHLNRIFRDVESMYAQYRAGRLNEELWQGISTSTIQFTKSPGVKYWWGTRSGWFGEPFSKFIQQHMEHETEPTLIYRAAGED
ncbi:MAG: hypothetical protein ACU84Q_14385 [Gammaproteobacteria bacterium]